MTLRLLCAREAIAESGEKSLRMTAVDIGNTAYKFGLFHIGSLDRAKKSGYPPYYPFSINDLRIVSRQLNVLPIWLSIFARQVSEEHRPILWLVSSVNRERTEVLYRFLRQKRPGDIFGVIDQTDVPVPTAYTDPAQLGIDRKLAALAASRRFSEPVPVFVVDIGTAVKFDLVDADGRFLGGAIMPGPETGIRSLFEKTEKLPELNWSPREVPKTYPAVNTSDAIRLGIAGGLVGSLLYFYGRALALTHRESLPVILTGGGSIGMEPFFRHSFREFFSIPDIRIMTVRDLILTGIELTRQAIVSK
ncbi:MAG: type III pantothenate kinase [Thermoguttaceae bacterium]|jgi:type III pantothenate kinase